jgi:glucose/arabinose dehydrogenase
MRAARSILATSCRRRPRLVAGLAGFAALSVTAALTVGVGVSAAGAQPAAGTALAATATGSTTTAPRVTFVREGIGYGPAVLVTNSGDGTGRLFIVDKVGLILSWRPGGRPTVYLDLRSRVRSSGDEQGLLGLTFYPDFKAAPLVFVTYTRSDNALQVARFRLSSYLQPSINAATEQPMFAIAHPFTNHNGGMITFGKDRYLYVSTGDGGSEGDPLDDALKAASPLGKILRVDATHGCNGLLYCIPPTNPFAHTRGADPRVWAYGLRNPWRFSVDPATGTLWIGDVGQNMWEEVDVDPAGVGGLNFGWSCMEGPVVYIAGRCSSRVHYVPPYLTYAHNGQSRAIIGGVVYRGGNYVSVLGHDYLFGDYEDGQIFAVSTSGRLTSTYVGSLPGVTSIGTSSQNEIWATTISGGLYVMVAT